MNPSEYNYTIYIESPLALFTVALIIYTEADFVTCFDSIDFMANLCSMEVNLSIFLRIVMTDRNAIWISILPIWLLLISELG